jgi:hypothetical protein
LTASVPTHLGGLRLLSLRCQSFLRCTDAHNTQTHLLFTALASKSTKGISVADVVVARLCNGDVIVHACHPVRLEPPQQAVCPPLGHRLQETEEERGRRIAAQWTHDPAAAAASAASFGAEVWPSLVTQVECGTWAPCDAPRPRIGTSAQWSVALLQRQPQLQRLALRCVCVPRVLGHTT